MRVYRSFPPVAPDRRGSRRRQRPRLRHARARPWRKHAAHSHDRVAGCNPLWRAGKPDQRWLDPITVGEPRAYLRSGEFGAGNVEPKVAAVADFVDSTPGATGIIGTVEEIRAIIDGQSGTRIVAADVRQASRR